MLDFIKSYFTNSNIEAISCLSLDECEFKRPYLLDRCGISHGSVIIFAVPYLAKEAQNKKNVSAYAVGRDYHLFFKQLFEKLLSDLKTKFPNNRFAAFSDHSPIDEIQAAKAGLGVIGKNHLLITEKYSSYVFLGEIITDADLPSDADKINYCIGCGKCLEACPVKTDINHCLSALTQKKGELSKDEKAIIAKSSCVWGCDICQEICPYTKSAIEKNTIFSNIEFFNQKLMPYITSEKIRALPDDEFDERAYSWRGRNTVLRNLLISEGKENGEMQ